MDEETIDKLWEQSNHGTRREDVVAAFNAGAESEREANKLPDSAMQLALKNAQRKRSVGNEMIVLYQEIQKMRDEFKMFEINTLTDVVNAKGVDGKAIYSNEQSRKAETEKRLSANPACKSLAEEIERYDTKAKLMQHEYTFAEDMLRILTTLGK